MGKMNVYAAGWSWGELKTGGYVIEKKEIEAIHHL